MCWEKGSVKLKVNGLTHVISDILFVPDLKTNLLSIGQLQDKWLTILIQHVYMNIYHQEKRAYYTDRNDSK